MAVIITKENFDQFQIQRNRYLLIFGHLGVDHVE